MVNQLVDYFLKWADEASAKADAVMLAGYLNTDAQSLKQWARDKVLPNVQVWRPSQDVGGVHTFLTGWFAIIGINRQVTVLLNATALQFALNRDGPPYIVRNNIGGIITDVAVSPVFLGSHYPVGGLS